MDPNITALIDKLATTLGVTTQYLWGVLIKQAPISATIELVQIVVTVAVSFITYRVAKKLFSAKDYDFDDAIAGSVGIVVVMVILAILLLIEFCSIGDVINGYFNPEYWALDKVLSTIHNSK